ncbi:cell envelope integrity EipB family protein [Rhizobiales bacterium]|uniref:cell envelope integrity EipB family protein n=1 Tax=Hongsoonwoonella zoysiae TaxID=2821844 RepID=UPI00156183E0|nr:cell envelope integrity EipB family protein [Hongsoonwoonella zoysiae]NRG19178.1 cell envelope integrity EipB family protein [Hongsoonwoonella zoysiae]
MGLDRIAARRLAALCALGAGLGGFSPDAGAGIDLMPHRAIYDMELGDAQDGSGVSGVSGRMVYEFTGGACEGYSVSFRFVTKLANSDGAIRLTDLQTSSFEEPSSQGYQFYTKTFIDRELAEQTKGRAEHVDGRVAISLQKPSEKKVELEHSALFPTEHLKSLLAAAERGERVLVADVFDGSETGEKVYFTSSIIGEQREGPGKLSQDKEEAVLKLGKVPHWPVTISYFEEEATAANGEETPVYQLGFLLYKNGVSRRLMLDYGDFKIRGRLVKFEPLETVDCPAGN